MATASSGERHLQIRTRKESPGRDGYRQILSGRPRRRLGQDGNDRDNSLPFFPKSPPRRRWPTKLASCSSSPEETDALTCVAIGISTVRFLTQFLQACTSPTHNRHAPFGSVHIATYADSAKQSSRPRPRQHDPCQADTVHRSITQSSTIPWRCWDRSWYGPAAIVAFVEGA